MGRSRFLVAFHSQSLACPQMIRGCDIILEMPANACDMQVLQRTTSPTNSIKHLSKLTFPRQQPPDHANSQTSPKQNHKSTLSYPSPIDSTPSTTPPWAFADAAPPHASLRIGRRRRSTWIRWSGQCRWGRWRDAIF